MPPSDGSGQYSASGQSAPPVLLSIPEAARAEAGGAPRRGRRRSQQARIEERRFWVFLIPWIIGFLAFGLGPLVGSAVLSLTNYSLLSAPSFIGIANYERLFTDPLFYTTMINTVYFGV